MSYAHPMDEIAELRRRLSAAETERDEARQHSREAVKLYDDRGLILRDAQLRRDQADNEARGLRTRLRAAEARVEAAEKERDAARSTCLTCSEARERMHIAEDQIVRYRAALLAHHDMSTLSAEVLAEYDFQGCPVCARAARAALACPPQQREPSENDEAWEMRMKDAGKGEDI